MTVVLVNPAFVTLASMQTIAEFVKDAYWIKNITRYGKKKSDVMLIFIPK